MQCSQPNIVLACPIFWQKDDWKQTRAFFHLPMCPFFFAFSFKKKHCLSSFLLILIMAVVCVVHKLKPFCSFSLLALVTWAFQFHLFRILFLFMFLMHVSVWAH